MLDGWWVTRIFCGGGSGRAGRVACHRAIATANQAWGHSQVHARAPSCAAHPKGSGCEEQAASRPTQRQPMTKGDPMNGACKLTAFLLFSFLVSPSPVAAAEPVDSAKAKAQATLREGNVALEQGRAEDALAKFTEAYRLFPSPKIHYNIGQAHSLIPGHEAQAYEAMLRFLIEAKGRGCESPRGCGVPARATQAQGGNAHGRC